LYTGASASPAPQTGATGRRTAGTIQQWLLQPNVQIVTARPTTCKPYTEQPPSRETTYR
jgi:hypothetical protein